MEAAYKKNWGKKKEEKLEKRRKKNGKSIEKRQIKRSGMFEVERSVT